MINMQLEGLKILVTGGAGFIGSHVSEELIKKGCKVTILDNLSGGRIENIQNIKNVRFIKGDITNKDLIKDALKDVDAIIHMAAAFANIKSIEDPIEDAEININGTLNLLTQSLNYDIKRFVYASSSAVYGDVNVFPLKENLPTYPRTPYAVSKLAGENYCKVFNINYGLPTTSLRFFNVFGPKEYPGKYRGIVANFIFDLLSINSPKITGDGTETRDYTYITDAIKPIIPAMLEKKAVSEVFNISTGVEVTTLELLKKIQTILHSNIKPTFVSFRRYDIKRKVGDITKAKKILGYDPKFKLEDGLRLTVDWMKKNYIENR